MNGKEFELHRSLASLVPAGSVATISFLLRQTLLTIDQTIHCRKYASTSRCICFHLIYNRADDPFRGNAPPIYSRESSGGGSKGSRVSNYPSNRPSMFCINPRKQNAYFPALRAHLARAFRL